MVNTERKGFLQGGLLNSRVIPIRGNGLQKCLFYSQRTLIDCVSKVSAFSCSVDP